MTPTELTAIGGFVLSLVALVILPLWFRRQARKQAELAEERQQAKDEELEERQRIKEQAALDAKIAEGEVVSWEKINQRLTITAQEERAAHQIRLAELRETFAEEVMRTKRQTDYELDRAKQEINRLSDRVEELNRQITALGPKSER
jgi:type II secretory pathway pseudopilin PulG